jgi:hypothetical protein
MYRAIDDSLKRISQLEALLMDRGKALDEGEKVSQVSPSMLPTDAASFVSHFHSTPPDLIQYSITHRISTLSFIARVAEASQTGGRKKEEMARLDSLTAPQSSLWMTVNPTEPALVLTDAKWRMAARLRLGMPGPSVDALCTGCKGRDVFNNDTWHALTCSRLSTNAVITRHNNVVNVFAAVCPLIHCPVRVEPAGLDRTDKKRPDMCIHTPSGSLLVDVTIIHPTAKSYSRRVAKHGVAAVGDKADKSKINKYADMTADLDYEFHSVVLYTYGGFHSSALKLINRLADSVDETTCLMSRARFKQSLMEKVAIAVQRGTADIMTQHTYRVKEAIQGKSLHRHLAQRNQTQWRPIQRVQPVIETITVAEQEEEEEVPITPSSELLLSDLPNTEATTQPVSPQQHVVETDRSMSDESSILSDISQYIGQSTYIETHKDERPKGTTHNTQEEDGIPTQIVSTMYTGMDMNNGDRSDHVRMNDDDIGTASLCVTDAVTNPEMRDAG